MPKLDPSKLSLHTLKQNKRILQSELSKLTDTVRKTRLSSVHRHNSNNRTIEELKRQILETDTLIEREKNKLLQGSQSAKMTTRTPTSKAEVPSSTANPEYVDMTAGAAGGNDIPVKEPNAQGEPVVTTANDTTETDPKNTFPDKSQTQSKTGTNTTFSSQYDTPKSSTTQNPNRTFEFPRGPTVPPPRFPFFQQQQHSEFFKPQFDANFVYSPPQANKPFENSQHNSADAELIRLQRENQSIQLKLKDFQNDRKFYEEQEKIWEGIKKSQQEQIRFLTQKNSEKSAQPKSKPFKPSTLDLPSQSQGPLSREHHEQIINVVQEKQDDIMERAIHDYFNRNPNVLNRLPQNEQTPSRFSQNPNTFNQNRTPFSPNQRAFTFDTQNQNIQEQPRASFLRRLRSIPVFNGTSHSEMREFLDVADSLYFSCNNNIERTEFFEQLVVQLRGEAANVIKNLNDPDWDTIKKALLSHFAYLSNRDIIASELENMRQEKNESLNKYAERARKFLQEKNSSYSNISNEQRAEHNRLARKAFARGINNSKLRDRLITRGANSLEDAIAFAIEMENDSINDVTNNELFCNICRITGHRSRDCRKNSQNSGIGQLITALRTLNVDRSNSNFPSGNNRGFNNFNRGNFNRFNNGNGSSNQNRNNNWNSYGRNNNNNNYWNNSGRNNNNNNNWNSSNQNRNNNSNSFGQNRWNNSNQNRNNYSEFGQSNPTNNSNDVQNRNFSQNTRRYNENRSNQNAAVQMADRPGPSNAFTHGINANVESEN